jgi:hypothetical protein
MKDKLNIYSSNLPSLTNSSNSLSVTNSSDWGVITDTWSGIENSSFQLPSVSNSTYSIFEKTKIEISKTICSKDIIDNIIKIFSFLEGAGISNFGKLVCAGGAVRDLLLGQGYITPKDYDIYIICGERKNDNREKITYKINECIRLAIENNTKCSFSIPDSNYDVTPVCNLTFEGLSVQIMYRPEIIGEADLIEDFDWNYCSAFISKNKNAYSFGAIDLFPGFNIKKLREETGSNSFLFSESIDLMAFLNSIKRFNFDKSKPVSRENSFDLYASLNSEQNKIKNPFYSINRLANFAYRYRDIVSNVLVSKKSLEILSKRICSEDTYVSSGYVNLFQK